MDNLGATRPQPEWRRWMSPILRLVHLLIATTAWVIFVSAYALSAIVFLHWGRFVIQQIVTTTPKSPTELIHALLLSIELLILVPAPALVGMVTYKTLVQISQPNEPDLAISEHQLKVAESLLVGLLISVTGMTLLDRLFTDNPSLEMFLCGGILIVVLAGVMMVFKSR